MCGSPVGLCRLEIDVLAHIEYIELQGVWQRNSCYDSCQLKCPIHSRCRNLICFNQDAASDG